MPRSEGEKSTAFPNKEARYMCWDARDKFWECLDAGGKFSVGLLVSFFTFDIYLENYKLINIIYFLAL